MLLEGKKVQLAELGNFWISIGSEGAEDLKKFTESNITAVNIVSVSYTHLSIIKRPLRPALQHRILFITIKFIVIALNH